MLSNTKVEALRTQWLNTVEFPYTPLPFDAEDGRMHYYDEGSGRPVLFLHGSPTWSFLYRKLIAGLAPTHRCVAVDHLGLGLSDKPKKADYHPVAHVRRLEALVEKLDLRDITLVAHDYGGPIGLDWAARNRSRVRDMVLMNTWCWSLRQNPVIRFVSHAASSRMNQYWLRLINPSPKFYVPVLFADRHRLPPWVQDQYQYTFNNQFETFCPEVLARAMAAKDGWFDAVAASLPRLADKPCLLLWGDRDHTYGKDALARMHRLLPNAAVHRLSGVGNYVPEEVPEETLRHISAFIS